MDNLSVVVFVVVIVTYMLLNIVPVSMLSDLAYGREVERELVFVIVIVTYVVIVVLTVVVLVVQQLLLSTSMLSDCYLTWRTGR